jgi:molybdopterin-guanine dinucleotide biosynthesis protein MobB
MIKSSVPVVGFAAYSGSGKTTLLKQLIPLLRQRGLRVGVVKHAHHRVEIDKPGKDSYELRKAGAGQVLLATGQRWALMVEEDAETDPDLQTMLNRLDSSQLDIVLVEGFRHVPFPKIEVHRAMVGKPLLYPQDKSIIAVATDKKPAPTSELPILDLNDPDAIMEFLWQRFIKDE